MRKILSFVVRWVCPRCGHRFTDLPPFAYPRKRYVRAQIVARCERYTEDDRATYRSSSLDEGLAVFHDGTRSAEPGGPGGPAEPDDRCLAPSTVWRWISSLSCLRETLDRALEMIRARSPSCSIFRRALLVPARKYRSDPRRKCLESVRRLIHADREYRPLYGGSIFPGVATASGWR
ncbi:MAG: hypothetical protein ACRETX_11740 [Steroidobacteraceae bacterium]